MQATILVIGGAGYIGTHMVKQLLSRNYAVVTLDNLSTGHQALLPGGVFIQGDLGDGPLLKRLFRDHRIDAVMHFAAFSLVGESVQQPIKYYQNNIAQTIGLIQTMLENRLDKFIFSSSAAVYGEPEEIPIAEEHPCRPTNPYGETKHVIEEILSACSSAYGLRSISLRYFNAAGADDAGDIGELHEPETHLIPLVLKAAASGHEAIRIFGTDYPTPDGSAVRDYIHVNDLVHAHILALEALLKGTASTCYNLGNSKGYSVREVIALSQKVTGRRIPVLESGRRQGDPAALVASSEKIKRELGWQPEYEDLETIIKTAWNWHNKRTDSDSKF